MNHSFLVAFSLALTLAAGLSSPLARAQDDTERMRVTTPPWTVEAVEAFWKKGLIVRTIETVNGGKEARRTEVEVTAADDQGLTMDVRSADSAGNATSTSIMKSWSVVYDALRFPLIETTVADKTLETPAGRFDCRVYRREPKIEGAMGGARTEVWLSKDRPGVCVKRQRIASGDETTEVLEEIVLPK